MVPCLLESVNNEERSLAIILSEPKKTSGRNDISQEVASSLSQKNLRSRSSLQNIHLSKYYLNICKVDLNSIRDTLFASEDLRERSCDVV